MTDEKRYTIAAQGADSFTVSVTISGDTVRVRDERTGDEYGALIEPNTRDRELAVAGATLAAAYHLQARAAAGRSRVTADDLEPASATAHRLGLTRRTVQDWARAGRIPGAVQTMGGHWRIPSHWTPSR